MTCLVTLEHVAEKVFLHIELALYNVFVYIIFLHHLLWWQSLSYQQTWLFWNSLWWYLGSLWAQSAFLFPRQARMSKSPSSSHWYKAILVFHLESKSNLIMYVSIIVHFSFVTLYQHTAYKTFWRRYIKQLSKSSWGAAHLFISRKLICTGV